MWCFITLFYLLQLSLEEYKDNTGRLSHFLFMWGKSNYMHGRSSPITIMKILCLYIMLRYLVETIKHLNSFYFFALCWRLFYCSVQLFQKFLFWWRSFYKSKLDVFLSDVFLYSLPDTMGHLSYCHHGVRHL